MTLNFRESKNSFPGSIVNTIFTIKTKQTNIWSYQNTSWIPKRREAYLLTLSVPVCYQHSTSLYITHKKIRHIVMRIDQTKQNSHKTYSSWENLTIQLGLKELIKHNKTTGIKLIWVQLLMVFIFNESCFISLFVNSPKLQHYTDNEKFQTAWID